MYHFWFIFRLRLDESLVKHTNPYHDSWYPCCLAHIWSNMRMTWWRHGFGHAPYSRPTILCLHRVLYNLTVDVFKIGSYALLQHAPLTKHCCSNLHAEYDFHGLVRILRVYYKWTLKHERFGWSYAHETNMKPYRYLNTFTLTTGNSPLHKWDTTEHIQK